MKQNSDNIQERLYPLSKMFNTFFIIHILDNTLARGKGCESNSHENLHSHSYNLSNKF